MNNRSTIYLSIHKDYVSEVHYADKEGHQQKFFRVLIPVGTSIDGKDISGFEFSPLFVNESRFKGLEWKDIPCPADKELWLNRRVFDKDGNVVKGEDGKPLRDVVKVMPAALKDALNSQNLTALKSRNATENTSGTESLSPTVDKPLNTPSDTDAPEDSTGLRIKRLMEQRAMTQAELADKSGLTATIVGLYIDNARAPQVKALTRLSSALGCAVEDLIPSQNTQEEVERAYVIICKNAQMLSIDQRVELMETIIKTSK